MKKIKLNLLYVLCLLTVCSTLKAQETLEEAKNLIVGAWESKDDLGYIEIYTNDGKVYSFDDKGILWNTGNYIIDCEAIASGISCILEEVEIDGSRSRYFSLSIDKDNMYLRFEGRAGMRWLSIHKRAKLNATSIRPLLNKLYQEHASIFDYTNQVVVYNSIDRVVASLNNGEFELLNLSYAHTTGNKRLTKSMRIKIIGNVASSDVDYTLVTNFSNWLKTQLKNETLKRYKVVRFEGCLNNNDCVLKPRVLFGGFVKYKLVKGMAIIDNIHKITSNLKDGYDGPLYKLSASYGYSPEKRNAFKFDMAQDSEQDFTDKQRIIRMQDNFKGTILKAIVPKYASKARFEDCENAYYSCDCIKPCR